MKAAPGYCARNWFSLTVLLPLILPILLSFGCTELDVDQDGWTVGEGDCEDLDPSIYPGAPEVCDWWDNNCNGSIDEGVLITFYPDADGDTWGTAEGAIEDCFPPDETWVTVDGDCDDTSSSTHPGATELCNSRDDDCDGLLDGSDPDVVAANWFVDMDRDGYGDPDDMIRTCDPPDWYVADGTDCDDEDPAVYPGALEVFNFVDDNCDGLVDEGIEMVSVAAGGYHSLASSSDGTVFTWGWNHVGQLGTGNQSSSNVPVRLADLGGIVSIAAGAFHSLAVDSDGLLWGWGFNGTLQLGNEVDLYALSPIPIDVPCDVTAAAAGMWHSIALCSDGTVMAWGLNDCGQLGDGTTDYRAQPAPVDGVSAAVAIAANGYYSMALLEDGTVLGWGDNLYGQLGDGTNVDRLLPVPVAGLPPSITIAAGFDHAMALVAASGDTSGALWTWGGNYSGQLGDGTLVDRGQALPLEGLLNVTTLSAGAAHSLAGLEGGSAMAFGDNSYGQLGDGTYESRATPVNVENLTGVTRLSGGYLHSMAIAASALDTKPAAWAWGDNYFWQLGDGTEEGKVAPVEINGLP